MDDVFLTVLFKYAVHC